MAKALLLITPEDVVLRVPLKRRPTFTPEIIDELVVDSVESSCKECDCEPDESIIFSPSWSPLVSFFSAILSRIFFLPSGSAIFYMNSMDDVNALVGGNASSPVLGSASIIVDDLDEYTSTQVVFHDNDSEISSHVHYGVTIDDISYDEKHV